MKYRWGNLTGAPACLNKSNDALEENLVPFKLHGVTFPNTVWIKCKFLF